MIDQSFLSQDMLFTEWHWSLELLFYSIPILAGIATAGQQAFLARNDFAMRAVLSIPVAWFIFFVALHEIPKIGDIALFGLAVSAAFAFLYGRWCALRLNHIGWQRWLALLLLVPIANFFWVIALFFIPGRKADAVATEAAS